MTGPQPETERGVYMEIRVWRAGESEKQAHNILEAKIWFQMCREMADAVENQRGKLSRWIDAATRITQNLSGMPGGGGDHGDKIAEAVTRKDTEARRFKVMEDELKKRRAEGVTRIFCIVSAEDKGSISRADYIRSYYIDCEIKDAEGHFKLKTYEDVAAEYGVSVSSVASGLKRGLEALAEIWPDIAKDCA